MVIRDAAHNEEVSELITIDRLDADIIGRLATNARIGIAELSAQLGVARNTVQSRIRRLEESGVLRGFQPVVGLDAVGVVVQAFVALELEQRRLAEVVEALSAIPHVLEITTQAGREDLLVRVAAPSHVDLQEVVTRMIDTPGVRHTVTTMAVSTPLPYRTQPLLELLTRESGFGRATPAST
jgi:DNA-binding Lrp family transcriptional regulator